MWEDIMINFSRIIYMEEQLSNCCGASIDGLNADNIGICSECKEGCGVEEVNHSAHISPEIKEWMGENPYTGIIDRKPQTPELSKLSEQKQ